MKKDAKKYFADAVERYAELVDLIGAVECGDFVFVLRTTGDSRPYLQIQCEDKCTVTGDDYRWHGRKWQLSWHMTDSEVVQTCWLAAKTAMEHELRERFKWEGECIFRPHFDIRALHEISRANRVEVRKEVDHEST